MHAAVITADIVNSTLLDKSTEKRLISSFEKILAPYPHEFYRGDSLQIYIKNAEQSYRIVLLLRIIARRPEIDNIRFDLKTSIGIGNVKGSVRDLRTAKGEAFLLSGRSFDKNILLEGKHMTIHCGKEPHETAFEILADYTDDIIQRLTTTQAGIVYELLTGYTQQEVARRLKKSQPTISKLARSANWYQLQELLFKFEKLIKLLPA